MPVVSYLEAAGAVLLGKLATWEYGTGNGASNSTCRSRRHAVVHRIVHRWLLDRGRRGRCGRHCGLCHGLRHDGSVRLPAAACGLAGVILPQDRISGDGIMPNCPCAAAGELGNGYA